jgi:sulfate adenylyltransferase
VAGDVVALRPLERGSHRALRRPAGTAGDGTSPVLGIPLRHLLHSPDVAAVRIAAARLGAAVLLVPLTGHGSPQGVSGDGLVRATLAAAGELRAAGLDVEVVPVSVPNHGAGDEAEHMLAALVARAHGATHVPAPLPRRDGLPEPLELPPVVQDLRSATWEAPEAVPERFRGPLAASEVPGVVDTAVARGEPVAAGLTTDVAVRELRRRLPGGRSGITVLFTGLSGSGKSTLARAVHAALLERTDRTVTLLDGDVVRRMLSAGLTFSRADRELNVRRIGFVASEITHHGGIALCAPIAPYAAVRAEVRAMVEEFGRFVLIHVNTPLAICEARDRKGLYARARRGEIPHFTGVSDPYEEPLDAHLTVDTSVVALDRAVDDVLAVLALSPASASGRDGETDGY